MRDGCMKYPKYLCVCISHDFIRTKLNMTILVLLAVIVAAALFIGLIFNLLISKKNQVAFAFASIDVQLKKRYDLIPNLVASCEKYMGHEQTVLKELTATRSQVQQGGKHDPIALDGQLSSQLRSVFALAENYPDLKAVESFTQLQRALNEVEEQLAASRRAFNAAVFAYNNAVQMFPTNLAASLMGYREKSGFEIEAAERAPVKVWR